MIKIILGQISSEATENYINLGNLLNENGYDCVIYGLNKFESTRCRSEDLSFFVPHNNDAIILDNISINSNRDLYKLNTIMDPIGFVLKKDAIIRWANYQKDKIKKSIWFPKNINVEVITNVSDSPIIDVIGQKTKKPVKIAGILTDIEADGQIDDAIKAAINDGMNKIFIFGKLKDPVYYYNKVRPLLEMYPGRIQYYGYIERSKIYLLISAVYDMSKSRKFPYLEMECLNNGVKLCSNHNLTYIKKSSEQIFEELNKMFDLKKHKKSNITVVLNGFRREYNLEKQIEALKNQSVKPDEIMLWYNNPGEGHQVNYKIAAETKSAISNENWGVWARFYYALNAKTKYVCVFDDDTIPGSRWLENCLETIKTHRGLLGTIGLIFNDQDNYHNHTRYGWANPNQETIPVDIVGHSWFFEREFLTAFCRELPLLDVKICGEDIHFSYTLQKHFGLKTFVPPHPNKDKQMWGSLKGEELGVDKHAISRLHINDLNNNFNKVNAYFKACQSNGWKLINFPEKK